MAGTTSRGLDGVVAAQTRLSHVDGLAGELIIGGYELKNLAGKVSFEEAAYLLWAGKLPEASELAELRREMAELRVPIVSCVIGEGGSGGALAIGVCDRLLMLQYSIYSVISPEGCAAILWKSADRRELAAEAMGITAERLSRLNLIDEVIPEPLGGAHREPQVMAESLREALARQVAKLAALPIDVLLDERQQRLRGFGVYGGA